MYRAPEALQQQTTLATRAAPASPTDMLCQDSATAEVTHLSLHDALPISRETNDRRPGKGTHLLNPIAPSRLLLLIYVPADRKSTRLNSSHRCSSYAVFCLKKNTPTPPSSSLLRIVFNATSTCPARSPKAG